MAQTTAILALAQALAAQDGHAGPGEAPQSYLHEAYEVMDRLEGLGWQLTRKAVQQ